MPDTSFINSYVLTDAVLEAYIGADPRAAAIALKALAAANQEWYCQRATKIIDGLSLKGRTYYDIGEGTDEQQRQFPRWIDHVAHDYDDENGVAQVPQAVIDACCEEAIALYAFYADSDRTDRKTMAEDGVQNYNLGGVYSETLGKSHAVKHSLMSSEAKRLLAGYIAGAVEMTF